MNHARRTTPGGWSVRWNADRAARAYAEGWWTRETCADALRAAALDAPERVLLVDGAICVTAAQLHDGAQRLASALCQRFAPGSVISFMLPNWHEAATIYLATTLAGMVAHPVLPSLRDHDLRFMLADAHSRMIFIPHSFRGHDYPAMLARVVDMLDQPPEVVVLRGAAGAHTAYPPHSSGDAGVVMLPALDPDDVRMVMYTSGTTGRPKGVLHTHNSLHALIRQIGQHWRVAPGDRFLVPSPISHIGGSIYAFEMPLLLGTAAVLMESWSAAEAVPLMLHQRITHMAGATPFLQQLLDSARGAGTRLPDLKVFICGGASVPPALIRDAAGYFDRAEVTRVYGSTEVPVTAVGSFGADERDHAADTDGRLGIAEVVLASDGEICARGPQMLAGYLHPEDEESAFDERDFYRTGDQGQFVAGDHLVITGRIKDLIIRNGENIAPKEIEDLLADHPAIAEIAIVGVPDLRTGERAVAVVVPRADIHPALTDLIEALARQGVARFKYPEAIAVWDSLPRNDAGKVLKVEIRRRLTAG